MLDPSNPYPEDLPITHITHVDGQKFPITNEEGLPTGLTMSMIGKPLYPYTFVVGVSAQPAWGKIATLEIDLGYTGYLNQVNIKPFTNFLPVLTQVAVKGFTSIAPTVVYQGYEEISVETRIQFPRQLVGTVYLTFRQEGFTAKDQEITDSNYVLRSVLEQIQNILPVAAQRNILADYKVQTGYQYDFGISEIFAIDASTGIGITTSGAYRFTGQPITVSFDSVDTGTVAHYIYYKATNLNGTVIDFNTTGILISPGYAICIPYATGVAVNTIAYVDFYIKHVLSTADASVTRFAIQVNDNV